MKNTRDIIGKPSPKFYLTQAAPCPYLADRMERKLFTHLDGASPNKRHNWLSQLGFRRSQTIAWRPACDGCSACQSLRVRVQDFVPSRSQQRLRKRAHAIETRQVRLRARKTHFALLQTYLRARHHNGGMADMHYEDYADMILHSNVQTQLLEYRLPTPTGSKLCAVLLRDYLSDGVSLVYSFYDPHSSLSLGSYIILQQIQAAQAQGAQYVYLGYWIAACRKMSYKTRFAPYELYGPNGWQRHDA